MKKPQNWFEPPKSSLAWDTPWAQPFRPLDYNLQEEREKAAREAVNSLRAKGGRARAQEMNRSKRNKYGRTELLKELKAIFRRDRSTKRAHAIRQLRVVLDLSCSDKTVERLFDKWKATERRLFRKRQ
jgi:hypothetical protein